MSITGPEFVCRSVRSWYEKQRVMLRYIDPPPHAERAYRIVSMGRFRDECLNANWVLNLASARNLS